MQKRHVNSLAAIGAHFLATLLLTTIAVDAQADEPRTPRQSGHYLIITAQDYYNCNALTLFTATKIQMGFDVTTYVAADGVSRADIKDYIQTWYEPDADNYILIVGDTNGTAAATSSTIPHWVGAADGAPTDLPYACMDGASDWYPDAAIGRFSVRTPTMLQDVVNKSLFVEAGLFSDPEYVQRAAFLASSDTGSGSEETHDWVIDNYMTPAGFSCVKIYANSGGGTNDIASAVNHGCLFVTYGGHSLSTGWWNPRFYQDDVNALTNTGLYGLVYGWSCNTAHYTDAECFGETWLRAPNKGAAAYLSASTYIYYHDDEWECSRRLEKYFFQSFFEDKIWEVGPAWQTALYRLLADPDFGPTHPFTRGMFEMMTLLGDPALRLPRSQSFSLNVTPESQHLCCPPQTMATYNVQIQTSGDSNEAVTLGAAGLPPGATAFFSANHQIPPYASTLTISNLVALTPDEYDFVITGSSASMTREAAASLAVSHQPAAPPTLLTPANNANGVSNKPALSWSPVGPGDEYEIQIAADPMFNTIVYSATTTLTSHTVETPLNILTLYHWRVRPTNACGDGDYAAPFSFTTNHGVPPVSYDMPNGQRGTYSYYDDAYDGDGDNTLALAPLSNGLGDLTDGVIAEDHWYLDSQAYVGWKTVDPTITFHFESAVSIDEIVIYLDDGSAGGGVHAPIDVTVKVGGDQRVFPCTDPPGDAPFAFSCNDLNMHGDTVELTIADYATIGACYIMLSEVQFLTALPTGACCKETDCIVTSQIACETDGGVYQGDDVACTPTLCGDGDAACILITEVVMGNESGDCPKWIEITNTGVQDFRFAEGGLIIQQRTYTDVDIDVKLAGVLIPAGQSIVINSRGACDGAFQIIYGFAPDIESDAEFGDGNDRYILTNDNDGADLLDIYGQFGVDGTGKVWEYTNGYAHRLSDVNGGAGGAFQPSEWFFGGPGSLADGNPTRLLLAHTTPQSHKFDYNCHAGDMNCDGAVDALDIHPFVLAITDPTGYTAAYPGCEILYGDFNGDTTIDAQDVAAFVVLLLEK